MVEKGKKKKRTKRLSGPFWLILVAILLSVLGFISAYFLGFGNFFRTVPVYEEIYGTEESLKTSIRRIDQTLFEVFFVNNVPDKNIKFLAVGPRQKKGQVWEFTDLAVTCSDLATCVKIEKQIVDNLQKKCPACLKVCEKNRTQIVCKIWVDGFLTHQISLLVSKARPSELLTKPKVALIIDDLGYDLRLAREFFRCEIPLSFSVLPYSPYCKKIAREARETGQDVLLHLPMEPINYPNVRPGPGAVLQRMSSEEIKKTVEEDIKQVPGICGVNNHMGSLLTEDPKRMRFILKDLAQRGLFYIDSRTSSCSVGYALASELGIPCAERDIFIDNDLNRESIKMQIQRLIKIGRRTGKAIGIGHPHRETLTVIRALTPQLRSEVELVPVSKLVARDGNHN